ncbi:hypothetical protein QNI19_23330 [Cytophagaceae bacterium DM2B3-1]|uniref:Uncharacterized protein n=1 Tax=Xanthocytophaga flava TaxID=3048013 RepID=A0ABT7CQ66_9BACT|nr:hypothetical protein [Xanthocytophaga flavus]MDJ1467993.1 hypothetical protein [Xanthocytophaga flavus]MDJ1495887.1 hypothetical protein [Xanthocytophaga flavus]
MDVRFKLYNTQGIPAWKVEQSEANFKKHYSKHLKKIEELLVQKGESETPVEIKIDIDLKNGKIFPPIVHVGTETDKDLDKYQELKKEILSILPA